MGRPAEVEVGGAILFILLSKHPPKLRSGVNVDINPASETD